MQARKILFLLPLILSFTLVASCNVLTEEANGDQKTGTTASVEQPVSMNLPCFGCHSMDRFEDPKVFPHQLHRDMGVHCNQCHVIKPHTSISLNKDTCTMCH